ncbi:glycosyltransferase family 8 protein [Lepidopterella palustris CBS 459.81]|uniref:Glycosyltransferase family 8 protein n=1 Tax=Lepidopterella palustris CBS 459.81 TaxID=1314670 RepID=A0A8E2JH19_9PEZI|nr:glycosyltransferase family 8 protein [Lepidopterella palustris CBS 459.81]
MLPSRRKLCHFLILSATLTTILSLTQWGIPLLSWLPTPEVNSLAGVSPRYAYATFLGPRTVDASSLEADSNLDAASDPYFTSVRLLTYQLLHSPKTQTHVKPRIPFLVLTLPSVPKHQLSILEAEGATIVQIEPLDLPKTFDQSLILNSRFRDVLSKLRLWQLTDYDRVLFIDADTILLSPLDSLFTDPELSVHMHTLHKNETNSFAETLLPSEYLLAASADTWGDQTEWLKPGHPEYLCACFMLLAPSEEMFRYYQSVLNSPEAPSNAAYPDQDLLIYAHRRDGSMPWRRIPVEWSANDGKLVSELVGGVRSLHVKAWDHAEGGNLADERTKKLWRALLQEMEAYYKLGH